MAAPSVTYTFTNGTSADATQVNTNFNNLISSMTDGTSDFTVGSLVVSNAVSLNGSSTTIGNATSDDLTVTARVAADLVAKTTSVNLGTSTVGWGGIYLGANSQTARIVASPSASATYTVTLPPATTATNDSFVLSTSAGALSFAHSVTTLKYFEGGATSIEYVGTNPEVGGSSPFQLTNAHKRVQIVNPAGTITVRLPTTGIKAGDVWTIRNRSSNTLIVTSSDATGIDTFDNGYAVFMALQDTPTTGSHWSMMDYYSEATFTSTYTFNGTGSPGTSASASHYVRRKMKTVHISIPIVQATTGTNSSQFISNSSIPAHYRSNDSVSFPIWAMSAGVGEIGGLYIATNGIITLYRANGGVWPNATATCGTYNGIANNHTASYISF